MHNNYSLGFFLTLLWCGCGTSEDRSLMRIVSSMTDAAVKFDILGTEPRKTVS